MNRDEDMSNTFVSEVGQRSAIFKKEDEIESLEEEKENTFPEVKIDPPTEMPSVLEEKKEETPNKIEEIEEDEEFLEAKKKKKSKKYKKRNPFVMFLIMVICLALGAGASYYYFEIYTEKDVKEEKTETKVEENKVEEIKPTSRFINQLIEKYDASSYSIDTYSQLYSKDKVLVNSLDATYVQQLGVSNIRHTVSFTKEDLQESLDQLFGKDTYKAQTEDINFNKCHKYKYSDDYYTLETGNACGGTSVYTMQRKTVKAVKDIEKNKLYIDVAVAINDGNKVYKGYDGTNGTEELTDVVYASFDIEKDYTKLNQYKYTFNYDKENNDYSLESVELVK